MITDREIWQAANAMIKRYGDDAAGEAGFRADALLVEGDAESGIAASATSRVAERSTPFRTARQLAPGIR